MVYDNLISDLTFVLAQNETKLIKIANSNSSCVISVHIEAGATYTIQSSLDSSEFVDDATLVSELFLENIIIEDVEQVSLNADIKSLYFASPNFLYIVNTSVADKDIKVSLRGNR